MAQTVLSALVTERGIPAQIGSVGLLPGGDPLPQETQDALTTLGYNESALRSHRSRQITDALIAGADLVVGMTREHVREVTVRVPEAWGRTFTLKELVS
jgi:protein-tyrosine phosphatase